MSDIRMGGCLCGAVRYRVTGPLRGVIYCHCSQCRKQTGHFYAATSADDDRLEIQPADELAWYAASDFAERGFCAKCGSALFWKRNDSRVTSILAGSLDEASGLSAEAHIFVADKPDYYQIEDGLPKFAHSNGGAIEEERTERS